MTTGPVVSSAEAEVILPPPSALNPIPSLPAALRLDNKEQLVQLLSSPPPTSSSSSSSSLSKDASTTNATTAGSAASPHFRQWLVFGDEGLRNLLLRQVLQDPHANTNNNKQTKKNWENWNQFTVPKSLQKSILGTKVLEHLEPRGTFAKDYPHVLALQAKQGSHNKAGGAGAGGGLSHIFQTTFGEGAGAEVSFASTDTLGSSKNPFDDGDGTSSSATSLEDPDLFGSTSVASLGKHHADVITYFIRPWNLKHTEIVAKRIAQWNHQRASSSRQPPIHHRVVYLPQVTALVQQLWMDHGLVAASNVSIQALQMDLFPLESDVISLEYEGALQEASLEGTPSPLVGVVARALLKLQDISGPIPRIQSLGPLGEDVLAKWSHWVVDDYLATGGGATTSASSDTTGGESSAPLPVLEEAPAKLPSNHLAMMIVDRKVDMVTPMVTPLTYEGLLDEVVGIDCGFLQAPLQTLNPEDDEDDEAKTSAAKSSPKRTNNSNSKNPLVVLGVHAGDTLFAEVRDQHVEKFGSFLQNQARALQESHAQFTNKGTKKDLNEIHQFVKQIPMFTQNLRSLTNHIHLAELIKAHTEQVGFREQWQTERTMIEGDTCYDTLEEWICSHHPIDKVLRALCLQSLCSGGVKAGRYDSLRSLIVQTYGYEYLLHLHFLEHMGWIKRKDTLWMDSANSSFALLRKSLILIHAEVDTVEPDDVAYVSSGYAPLTVRLIQSAVQGWTKSKAEILKELPGRLIDIQTMWPPQDLATTLQQQTPPTSESLGDYAQKLSKTNSRYKPTLIVVFCGGITYMEIAALRFLSKRPTFPYNLIMVTTKIVNGSSLLQQTLLK